MITAYEAKRLPTKASEAPLEDAYLAVEGSKIVSVTASAPVGAEVGDLGDVTLMPGLIDAHVHMAWTGDPDPEATRIADGPWVTMAKMAKHALDTLKAGMTTCRDVGSACDMILGLRRATALCIILGPRIIASGGLVVITGGHGYFAVRQADGPDEVRKAVREVLHAGADLLKVAASGSVFGSGEETGSLQKDLNGLSVAVREAHKAGRKVVVHVYPAKGDRPGVRSK